MQIKPILSAMQIWYTDYILVRHIIKNRWNECFMRQSANIFVCSGLTGPLADALRRINDAAGKSDGTLDPALLKELADLKSALNAVNAEMRRPSVSFLLRPNEDTYPVTDNEEVSIEDSEAWPMEWDECWEERWAAIEEMLSNQAFKDKVMRILSQTSIKV